MLFFLYDNFESGGTSVRQIGIKSCYHSITYVKSLQIDHFGCWPQSVVQEHLFLSGIFAFLGKGDLRQDSVQHLRRKAIGKLREIWRDQAWEGDFGGELFVDVHLLCQKQEWDVFVQPDSSHAA